MSHFITGSQILESKPILNPIFKQVTSIPVDKVLRSAYKSCPSFDQQEEEYYHNYKLQKKQLNKYCRKLYEKQILQAKKFNCNALAQDLTKVRKKQRGEALRFFAGKVKNNKEIVEKTPRNARRSNQQYQIQKALLLGVQNIVERGFHKQKPKQKYNQNINTCSMIEQIFSDSEYQHLDLQKLIIRNSIKIDTNKKFINPIMIKAQILKQTSDISSIKHRKKMLLENLTQSHSNSPNVRKIFNDILQKNKISYRQIKQKSKITQNQQRLFRFSLKYKNDEISKQEILEDAHNLFIKISPAKVKFKQPPNNKDLKF